MTNNRLPFGIGDFIATFKGDAPGHPFRGNQFESGSGSSISGETIEHHAKKAGDEAESATRNRYKISDLADAPHDEGKYTPRGEHVFLHDSSKGDRVVASGTHEQIKKRLESLAKTARNKAEQNVRDKVRSIQSDIEHGFYKNTTDNGLSDLNRALSGAMKELQDDD